MLTLSLETSTRHATAALLRDQQLIGEAVLPPQERTAEAILPAIHGMFEKVGVGVADVELIGVSIGPGSFTGLRIGVVIAKTLAYASGISVVAVNSLQVVARQAVSIASERPEWIQAVADAQRGQLYAQLFTAKARPVSGEPARIVDVKEFVEQLSSDQLVCGEGLKRIGDRDGFQATIAPEASWRPLASTVAQLALERFARGDVDDFWRLTPHYLRVSAAEEKLEERDREV